MARESAITKSWRERAQWAEAESMMWTRIVRAQVRGETFYASTIDETDDYGTTEHQLWMPTAPDGGVVLSIWRDRNDDPIVRVHYLDALLADAKNFATIDSLFGFRLAMERLSIERHRANQAAA